MHTHFLPNRAPSEQAGGYSLLLTVIVLALLGVLGVAGLHVASLNIRIAANERDAKDAFFQADSGVNIGHVLLEDALLSVNASLYDDGSNASLWQNESTFDPSDFPTVLNRNETAATYIRCGMLRRANIPGTAAQIGTGYEGEGLSASSGGVSGTFLIRAHRDGHRGAQAEIDLGWEHVIR